MRRGTIPGPTRPGFNHTGPCAAPSFMEGEAASPSLPPSVIPTPREDARTSNIHIMPDCSSLSRHTAPQNLASLLGRGLSRANPLSLAVSCVSSALRSFWPVWPQMRLPRCLSCSARPSGHCPLTGGLQDFGNAVFLTVPPAPACCTSAVLLG